MIYRHTLMLSMQPCTTTISSVTGAVCRTSSACDTIYIGCYLFGHAKHAVPTWGSKNPSTLMPQGSSCIGLLGLLPQQWTDNAGEQERYGSSLFFHDDLAVRSLWKSADTVVAGSFRVSPKGPAPGAGREGGSS